MTNVKWCLTQKDGIKIVDPNQNLALAYIKKAEDSLLSMRETSIKDWKISTAYYAIYFSLYAILNRIGVKCEIHTCTIEFANFFLKDYFSEDEIEFLRDSMSARIDSQYYTDRKIKDDLFEKMVYETPRFLIKCKEIINKINEKKIKEIRAKIDAEMSRIKNKKKSK